MALIATRTRKPRRGNYAYAVARIRAKKAKLLPKETYAKMLKMSLAEVTQTVRDSDYREQVDSLASRFEGIDLVESALNVNEEHTYATVRAFCEGEAKDLVRAFLDRYDFRDIKVILRGKHYGASQEEMLSELLIEDRDEFEFLRGLLADNVQGVDGVINALLSAGGRGRDYWNILQGAKRWTNEPTLADYEDALDYAYYTHLLETIRGDSRAKKLFRRLINKEIDVVNLLAVLRYKRASEPWDAVAARLVPGGLKLDTTKLRQVYDAANMTDVGTILSTNGFGSDLDEALATGSLSEIDIAAQRHLTSFAQGFSHMNPLSILPIIDYLLRKHIEVRNLRTIGRGKEAGLDEDAIQAMLIL